MVRLFVALLRSRDWLRMRYPATPRRPGPQRVLFLRPDRIGDMIVSTGVLRALGGAPGVVLDVLASPANAPVLAHEPRVREVLVLDRSRWSHLWRIVKEMRAKDYDVVVDCMPTAPSVTTLMLMLASGARRRVGTSGRGIDEIFSPATPSLPLEAHIVDHLALFVAPFRTDAALRDPRPVLVLRDDESTQAEMMWNAARESAATTDSRLRLLVNISAGKTSRRWPLASYAAVIAAARTVGIPTVDMLLTGKASQWGLYRAPGVNLESPDDSLQSLTASVAGAALQQVLTEVMLQQRRANVTSHPTAA